MNKPYILCHMMTSVDGRIDCAMTEHLPPGLHKGHILQSRQHPKAAVADPQLVEAAAKGPDFSENNMLSSRFFAVSSMLLCARS